MAVHVAPVAKKSSSFGICFAGLSLRLIGRRSLFPQLVLLQAHQLLAYFSSQYLADFRIFRKEFRVIADYSADLRRSPYVFYNMGPEHLFFVDREFFYFGVSKYSDGKTHDISPLKSCWLVHEETIVPHPARLRLLRLVGLVAPPCFRAPAEN